MPSFKTIVLSLALAAGLASTACAKDWSTIRIATEGAYAPWNFTEGGELKGFEIDLIKHICEQIKATCEIEAQNWDGIIPGLTAGKYDAIVAAISITDKRLQVIDFSVPYARSRNGVFTAPDSPLAKLAGTGESIDLATNEEAGKAAIEKMRPLLEGKTLGVQGSTTNAAFVEKYLKGIVEVREYKTTEQQELDLLAGRIDGIVQANTSLANTKKNPQFKGYDIFGPTFFGGSFGKGVAIGLRKDEPELKAKFDEAIRQAIADGTVRKLATQWFNVDLTPVQN